MQHVYDGNQLILFLMNESNCCAPIQSGSTRFYPKCRRVIPGHIRMFYIITLLPQTLRPNKSSDQDLLLLPHGSPASDVMFVHKIPGV